MTEHIDTTSHPDERLTLRKSAKLRHRTLVQDLFKKGRTVYSGPLRVTFRPLSESDLEDSFREEVPDRIGPIQMMITVPKKKRRHAVDRVLMRRRIREAFRLSCRPLRQYVEGSPDIRTLSIAIIYLLTENCDMPVISSSIGSALAKIGKKLDSKAMADAPSESKAEDQDITHKTLSGKPLL